MHHTELNGKLGKILVRCNAKWYDDPITLKRHIKGNFTEDDKSEIRKICEIYYPIYHTPEIVFD